MMEFKLTRTKKLLVVFAMIFVRATLQMDTVSSTDIQKVEEHLLTRLGLKRRPMVDRKKAQIPQEMINLYKQKLLHKYDSTSLPLPGRLTKSANVVRSYTHQESSLDLLFAHDHKFRLYFDLENFPQNEIVTSAELKLSIVPNRLADQRITVYDIVQPGIKGITKPILRQIDIRVISATSDQTVVHIDVLPSIERWLQNHTHNYGLIVVVKSPSGQKIASHVRLKRDTGPDWHAAQPLLLVYSDDANRTVNATEMIRKKRNATQNTQRRSKRRRECSRHPLSVDFKEVGWNDWIVAPEKYDAYYCAGECPSQYSEHLNATNHAIIQSLVHTIHPETIPRPCCVPTTLNSISLLYLTDDNIAVLKNYQDMVVEGCGCR